MRTMLTAFAVAALIVSQASAQGVQTSISEEAKRDLECAMWASFVAGSQDVQQDVVTGMGYALSYWIGRFEGATGLHFDDVATVDFVIALDDQISMLAERCAPEMEDMGGRLQVWGARMVEAGEAAQP